MYCVDLRCTSTRLKHCTDQVHKYTHSRATMYLVHEYKVELRIIYNTCTMYVYKVLLRYIVLPVQVCTSYGGTSTMYTSNTSYKGTSYRHRSSRASILLCVAIESPVKTQSRLSLVRCTTAELYIQVLCTCTMCIGTDIYRTSCRAVG